MTVLAEALAVTKCFGTSRAVDAVDLEVGAGEVVGLLGANGAGKTTLIRLLLGLLVPDGGSVRVFGAPPSTKARRRIGYMPQTLGLYRDLTVEENWRFAAAAYGTGGGLPPALAAWRGTLAGALPLGAQRQVAFALAFAHDPALLVLDEPTSGVGPLGGARLWEQVRAATEGGAGSLVTTHNLEEAEQCDRLVVMADGRVAAAGTVAQIVSGRVVAEVRSGDWRAAFAVLDAAGLPAELHGGVLRANAPAGTVDRVLGERGTLAQVRAVPADLGEAFVQIVDAGA